MAANEIPRCRDYDNERKRLNASVSREEVTEHPLKPMVSMVTDSRLLRKLSTSTLGSASSSGTSTPRKVPVGLVDPLNLAFEGSDPLSQFVAEMDPLSKMASEYTMQERKESFGKGAISRKSTDENFEPWCTKKAGILSKYTTSEKLSIATSFLSGGEKVVIKTQSSVTDKVKNRLEQLDDFEEGSVREMLNLSQQEYVHRIDELNQALLEAWEQDQRVKALKIVIQCSKLLVDTSVIQFYPSKFVLITDILDTFGQLVYERIRIKAEYYAPGNRNPTQLPENFTPEMVPESAKETCRNWFFKIASIRELIPRLYVEIAVLKSYNFLTSGEFSKGLMRLSKIIRGIGDPIVAAYARCYLCRMGMSVAPEVRNYLYENLYDFLMNYNQLSCAGVQVELSRQKVEFSTYLTLYSPAVDWILQCIAYKASESLLPEIMERCKQQCNSALLLNSIMAAFQPEFIANRSLQFVEMMKECEDTGFPKHFLFRTLGLCLVVADPHENVKLQVLNDVWKIVTKLKNPSHYMSCAEIWIEYTVKHFSKREVNTFLGDIIKHLTPDRAFENHYSQLQGVVDRILNHMHDFSVLFAMDKFLPFVDMFQKESVKVDMCKLIMEAFSRNQLDYTNDPVIINAMMFIAKTAHDSVNALTVEDEKRQIANCIIAFIRKVNFGRDFEQQLNFYVETRQSFSNLEPVLIQLVHHVSSLAMQTRNVVKGHHTRKTAAFARACAAYTFITIPSLTNTLSCFELYLTCGQVALLNQCLGQADACFKAAVNILPELPKMVEIDGKHRSIDPFLKSYVCNFLSTLLVVPDNPEHGVLYLLRGLLNVLHDYVWDTTNETKVHIYLNVLDFLSALSQESYYYHIDKVDSNDRLYGSDPKFLSEVNKMIKIVLDEILSHFKQLRENDLLKQQANLCLELINHIVAHADITNESVATLTVNLWLLAHKEGHMQTKLAAKLLESIKRTATNQVASKLQTINVTAVKINESSTNLKCTEYSTPPRCVAYTELMVESRAILLLGGRSRLVRWGSRTIGPGAGAPCG
uniref:VPS35 endosomal protein-sorting factor-like n=1 Tax=Strigamia maritima TaxID=126957 RepID=T1JKK3_STRMM